MGEMKEGMEGNWPLRLLRVWFLKSYLGICLAVNQDIEASGVLRYCLVCRVGTQAPRERCQGCEQWGGRTVGSPHMLWEAV